MGLNSSKYSCASADDVVLGSDWSAAQRHKSKEYSKDFKSSSEKMNSFFKSSKSKVVPYEEPKSIVLVQSVVDEVVVSDDEACVSSELIQRPCEDPRSDEDVDVDVDEEEVEDENNEQIAASNEPYVMSSYFSFKNGDVLFLKISHDTQPADVPVSTFVGWECHVQQKGIGITRAAKWLSRHLHLFIHFMDGRKEFIKVKGDDSKDYNVQDLLHGQYLPMNVTFLQRIFKA